MKTWRNNLLWILLPLPLLGAESPAYVSADGRFTCTFPGKPREQATERMKVVAYETASGGLFVAYADLPDFDSGSEKAVEAILSGAVQGAVLAPRGGKKISDKALKLDGKYPGREIVLETAGSGMSTDRVKLRVFVVGKRLFEIMTVGSGDWIDAVDSRTFLDSFAVAK